MTIRKAQLPDAAALSALAIATYTEAFGHSFTATDLAAHLAKHLSPDCFAAILGQDTVLVAETDGDLVGYVQFGPADSADAGEWELRRLYVRSDRQNRGVGAQLMENALSHLSMRSARRIYLDVWEHNPGARRFYERFGFAVVGTRTFEVASGAPTSNDLIMVRIQT